MAELRRVDYGRLNARQKEAYNFHKVAAKLADYGYNCIKLSDDWQGADFLAYHKDGEETLKVQLKARVTIGRKYLDKNLYMAFPIGADWYLVAHDELVAIFAETNPAALNSASWTEKGSYHIAPASSALREALVHCKLV